MQIILILEVSSGIEPDYIGFAIRRVTTPPTDLDCYLHIAEIGKSPAIWLIRFIDQIQNPDPDPDKCCPDSDKYWRTGRDLNSRTP